MLFNTTTIELGTQVTKDSGTIVTKLTITGCEVPEEVIANSLLSGQSPRVRLQNGFRANGIPKVLEISWLEYIKPGRITKVVVKQTDEEIAQGLLSDPKRLKEMLALLNLTTEETEETAE